ncbi:MAG: hypothetical protein H8E37_12255 [Planctomycetes bacterium]|nr:hypothetical protein [Planctomycetota bacterium]
MPRSIDFQKLALVLAEAADLGRPVKGILRRRCSRVVSQIESDGSSKSLLRLWGLSINEDEIAGETIVHPAIIQAIGELAGEDCPGNDYTGEVVHAGLQHTYGYLFSTIETPFGFKRDRWIEPVIEDGLGISEPTLRPHPTYGTLLANLTYLLGRIAFRGRPGELKLLRGVREHVSPAVLNLSRNRAPTMMRVEETIRLPGGRDVSLHTDFVPFDPPTEAAVALLIYWVRDGREKNAKLVTAFPVRRAFLDEFLDEASYGRRKQIRTRYNAFVTDLTGQERSGSRSRSFVGEENIWTEG